MKSNSFYRFTIGAACLLLASGSMAAETFSFQNLNSGFPPLAFEESDVPFETKSKKLYSEPPAAGNIKRLLLRLRLKGFTSETFSDELQKEKGLPSGVSHAEAQFFLTYEPRFNDVLFLSLKHADKDTETDAVYDAVFVEAFIQPDGIKSDHNYKHSPSLESNFTAYLGSLEKLGFVCADDRRIASNISKICKRESSLDGKAVLYEARVFLLHNPEESLASIVRFMDLRK